MNQYQNLATLFLRLFGAVIAVVGILGPLYIGFMVVIGKKAPTYSYDRWAGSVLWAIAGFFLLLFSKSLGRLFGRGLD
jgi:hypothetical protein